ncbi:hypothetical protein [Mastigocladopsis repens]|uniref:hypothetical protein n=1 Tax=Mastigocladopsis repens TaxID=221287 RepID=UPI000311C9F2|nr:hypothetical protein [Mastigocladopsis repens]
MSSEIRLIITLLALIRVKRYLEPQIDNGHLLSPAETLREQRGEPSSGFASRLRRETRLQRWTHRNAVSSRCTPIIYLCPSVFICGFI